MHHRHYRNRSRVRYGSFLLGLNLVLLPAAARADILGDANAPANQRPTVLNAGNGVPLVNIQTPSAAGVSRNTYSQFDVNANGAILNNSRTDTQTQLGGWVQGNPQLATGSARVILNEVNASDPSRLNGFVEVAGSAAQVVVANPAGISCDGCGFVNANRATLSTGTPILNNGNLEGYRVTSGTVQIDGAGLNAANTGYTDLIGQAVQVNAGVWAQRLNVVAGTGDVNAQASGISAANGNGAAPAVAIDVAQLGGMYANSIHLVGTDAGVGVRNAGQIGAAAGEVTITADGRLENSGAISAAQVNASADAISNGASGIVNAQQLNVQTTGNLDNQGEIAGTTSHLQVNGTLNNQGVIDGDTARLQTETLNNTGTGRIYGDTLAIGATTVNNVAEVGATAPVIAARERLDIGAQTINNIEHAQIFSAGDMAIGGALDANNRATGQADTLNNASATVQANGDLDLAARNVDNSNEHLTTDEVQISSERIHVYGGEGSPNRYSADQVDFIRRDRARDLRTPDGTYRVWYEYDYLRTVTETQVVTSDPAQILAGGNLNLNTGTVKNDNSRILAGGDLTGTTDSVENIQHAATTETADNGTVTRYRRVEEDDAAGSKSHWEQRSSTTGYHPVETIIHPEGLRLAQRAGGQSISGNGTQLPNNSLYSINPNAPQGYLVETDPRFANYRHWISSDYMLQQLAVDPATAQMRLGDGFYEQQLIREQLAQLTGRRFLEGYSDDEAQYAALLDAGVTFAQAHELRPGVSLSAEQIAQLTSDIVWLVEQSVTLEDGRTEKVLVPQLYVRVRDDGLNGNGALITAENIQLEMNAGLNNQGTIAGRRVTALTAENIDNVRGTLQGDDVQLTARNDINNKGGSIRAQHNLNLTAGHDINVVSTTVTNHNEQGSRTNIDRIAGLYVESGSLKANAGHDINLSGAAIVNNTLTLDADRLGNTELIAGNDFMLNSVQENEQQKIVWNPGTYRSDVNTRQTGTTIQSTGNVLLQAGRDLTGTAANITSTQSAVHLAATRDLHIRAGVNETHIEGRGQTNRSQADITRHTIAGVSAAEDVTLTAGGDMNLTGAALQSKSDVTLKASGDTFITAVVDTEYHYDREKQKRSYGRSESSTDETLTSTVVGGTLSSGNDLLINAHKNSQGEIISEQSGAVSLTGVQAQAQGDLAIAGDDDVKITAIQYHTLDFHQTQKSGLGGLSKKDEGNASTEARLQNAQLASGGNTSIASGRNLNLIAADVTANGDVNLEAVDALLIGAGQVLSSTEQWKNESSAFSGGHLYELREHRAGETVSVAQASSINAGGKVTARAGTGRVVGSDIHGEKGVDLKSDAGDFTIENAQTTRTRYSQDKEVTVSLGDATAKGLVNPALLVQTNDGRLMVHLADAQMREAESKTTTTAVRGSRISSGENIQIVADTGSVNIVGSDLTADTDANGSGDIQLSAAHKINIGEAVDTATTQNHTRMGEGEASLVVQHQAVEVVNAYKRLEDAKEQLENAKRDYKDYERNLDKLKTQLNQLEQDYANKTPGVNYDDLLELRDLVEQVKDDKDWYVAGIGLATVNLASATTALIQQTGALGPSFVTFGFNAGLQLDLDASTTDSRQQSATAVASTLSGQNIRLQTGTANGNGQRDTAGSQTNIQGSQLLAQNNITITTGDLNVTASKNTYSDSTETEQGHITAQMTVYGAAGGASVNASANRSKSSSQSTTYNNSFLLADNIDLKTSGDATFRGATVRAELELNADIQGNLTVESVQNRSSSRNTSAGVSGGFSLGGTDSGNDHVQGADQIAGLSGVNAGVNSANGMCNSKQTVLTSLTSGGTANINVKNHTQVTGALIGTTDENGNDLNQLNVSTDTINFTDLRDSHVSSQTSAGISTNVGVGNSPLKPGQANTAEGANGLELKPGTSNLTYANSQQNSASNTLATLGHGTISVGGTLLEQNGELTEAGAAENSVLTGLNRDTADTLKELWNSDYSQELDATVDHRLLTPDGHNQIHEDAKRTEILGESIVDLADSSVSLLGMGEGETDLREHVQNKQDFFTATKHFANDPANKEFIDIITSGNGTPAEKDAAYTALANSIALQLGVDPVKAMTLVQEHYQLNTRSYEGTSIAQIIQGAYAPDPSNATTGQRDGLIFLVDDNIGNSADAVRILGHETSHHLDANRNPDAINSKAYHDNRESYANIMGNAAVDYTSFSFAANGYSALGTINTRNGSTLQSPTIVANNAQFNRLDPNTVEYRRLRVTEAELLERARAVIQEDSSLGLMEKTVQEKQLNAVVCAAVRCADGIHEEDPAYKDQRDLQVYGESLISKGVTVESLLAVEDLEDQFEYTWWDERNDDLTSTGEVLYRVEAGMQFAGGVSGMAGGIGIAGMGASACGASLGASCLLVPAGSALAVLGAQDGANGLDRLIGDFSYTEGQAVADSFYMATHPGDVDPAGDLAKGIVSTVLMSGTAALAKRYLMRAVDDTARSAKELSEATNIDTSNNPAIVDLYADGQAKLSASQVSAQWQGEYPYWGIDLLTDSGLQKGEYIVQLTFRTDGVPTSSYFTTMESLQKAQVGGGKIDANVLNQGLQTFPSGRDHFKLYAQIFKVDKDVPLYGAARGDTAANPYFNPSNTESLEQVFVLDEFKGGLNPVTLIKLDNTRTPEYLPLDQITNNMLRTDTQ